MNTSYTPQGEIFCGMGAAGSYGSEGGVGVNQASGNCSANPKAADSPAGSVIGAAGWEDAFLHGTGHGVGLDIHEDPRVGQSSTATLVDRNVVTVEPGVYLPEHGGVRIEDTVVVTPEGCRPITLTPKSSAI